jgi:hypothetical protein
MGRWQKKSTTSSPTPPCYDLPAVVGEVRLFVCPYESAAAYLSIGDKERYGPAR